MTVKKVTVNLPEEQVQFLQELAKSQNVTFTDALRRAISAEKFFVEQSKAGRKILVEEQGKPLREVIVR